MTSTRNVTHVITSLVASVNKYTMPDSFKIMKSRNVTLGYHRFTFYGENMARAFSLDLIRCA
ncbi:MAG: hypothetical protein ABJO86_06235 [Lentilitoribacter sp.]